MEPGNPGSDTVANAIQTDAKVECLPDHKTHCKFCLDLIMTSPSTFLDEYKSSAIIQFLNHIINR